MVTTEQEGLVGREGPGGPCDVEEIGEQRQPERCTGRSGRLVPSQSTVSEHEIRYFFGGSWED